jgi:hypothetical protein
MVEALNFLPLKQNISIKSGATLDIKFSLYDRDVINGTTTLINITNFTFTFLIREKITKTTIITATVANGRVVLSASIPTINILINSTDTALIPVNEYEYYLRGVDASNKVFDVLEGSFFVGGV